MTTTNAPVVDDATVAAVNAWSTIALNATERVYGARFGAVLATFDGASVASLKVLVKLTGTSKSTVDRYMGTAVAVGTALGADNLPGASARNADALAVFHSLASALGKIDATHRAGVLERLATHADSLADLTERAADLLEQVKEAREATRRGARPEGNAPTGENAAEAAEAPVAVDAPAAGPRALSSILGELAAHLNALPAEDLADALDEVSALVDEASARIFA